ncbi:hypothetical protein AFL01nite_15820 [Aeromicrobium flavum]|uniref:Uncharacterized protein n=1 Tax=Aeromicrobium flavum TaxID=416568 RepID=A0A512HUZ0_9ACTN|nr:hypothetical protein [Aeromicrobium flavum]GEO89255.1 hypothetical protein AFL01nite_15820 [Aeromicrobium flavum]
MSTHEALTGVRSAHRTTPVRELLHADPSVLLGVDAAALAALELLDVRTVFDLATSGAFAAAAKLATVSGNPTSPLYQQGAATSDLVHEGATAVPVAEMAGESIAILQAIPPDRAAEIAAALDVTSVQEMADFPPYLAAIRLLNAVFFPENEPGADPERPADLVPVSGEYPTERVQYTSLLMDEITTVDEQRINILDREFKPLDLAELAVADRGFNRVAFGALLTFTQSWFAQGVTLGQLLHSTALAPGESTRIAVVDWTRRSRAGETETISEVDDLSQSAEHNRAINEVTNAVATEAQQGFSQSNASSSSTQFGMSMAAEMSAPLGGLLGGPSGSMGTSLSTASSSSHADSYSSSFGRREVGSSMLQNVNDRTHQQAHSSRNRRASVVKEVAQSEHESVSTRVVANYNHMHALTVQYYEVVQVYRIETAVSRADKVVFVPVALPDFSSPAVVRRFQSVLSRAALTMEMREALRNLDVIELTPAKDTQFRGFDRPLKTVVAEALIHRTGPTKVVAMKEGSLFQGSASADAEDDDTPAAVVRASVSSSALLAEGSLSVTRVRLSEAVPVMQQVTSRLWLDDQVSRLAGLLSTPLLRPASAAMYLPTDVLVEGVTVSVASGAASAVFDLASGQARRDVSPENPLRLSEVRRISVGGAPEASGEATVTLTLNRNGVRFPLRLPDVVVSVTAQGSAPIVEVAPGGVSANIVEHLNQNKLHYAQSIYRSLDASQVAMLLSGHTITMGDQDVPLVQVVDPTPIRYIGNYLAFAMNVEPTDQDWGTWLKDHGIVLGRPREDLVPLGTGGTFAEAVLGRSNSAEKLDITRFWNWQDSPIPLAPTDIAAVQMGSRATAEDTSPGQLSAPIINLQTPTSLPDPAGTAAVLGAVQNGQMFRDMSGLQATVGLAQAALQASAAGASTAGQQAGTNMNSLLTANTERQRIAASMITDLAKTAASMYTGGAVGAGGGGGTAGGSPSQDGAKINYFDKTATPGGGGGGTTGSDDGTGPAPVTGGQSGGGTPAGDAAAYSKNPAALAATWGDTEPASGLLGRVMEKMDAGLGSSESPQSTPAVGPKSAWPHLTAAKVMSDKDRVAADPNTFQQGALGLCTAAAFFHHLVQRDPMVWKNYINSLFGSGTGFLGKLKVHPGDDLRAADHTALAAKHTGFPPQGEWMAMCALRDSENWIFDFDGSPDDEADMETSMKEMAGWYEDTELWSDVKVVSDTDAAAIKTVKKTASNQVAFWIRMPMIGDSRTSTHMITIESPIVIDEAADTATFDYWTWAQPVKTLSTTWTTVKNNFLGAIVVTK